MALNFPTNTSQPYYDPISGLKYIYNDAIGAWETAIQPPAIIRDTAPNIDLEGFLWWDSDANDPSAGTLKVRYQNAWVDATPAPASAKVDISSSPPNDASSTSGDLWWSDDNGRLYVYYNDGNSSQWVDASPEVNGEPEFPIGGGAQVTVSTTPPSVPQEGDLWFNSGVGNLYIAYLDPDTQNMLWITTTGGSASSAGLNSFIGTGAVTVGGSLKDPTVAIRDSTTSETGVVKLADSTEAATGTSATVALSPSVLKNNIGSYLNDASATVSGIVELATNAEVATGTDTTKAITPAGLTSALPSLGLSNPVGTIIEFANTTAPTGYLKCDGSLVSRSTYANLFAVVGTSFGGGDGATTFKLPTLAHTNAQLIYSIKF